MLVNPVSGVILEWTLCDGMFCVILFGVCSRSVSHLTSCDVTCPPGSTRSTDPSSASSFTFPLGGLVLCRWRREAGPGRRGRSRGSRTEGCTRRRRLPNSTGNPRGPSGTQTQQHTASELRVSTEAKLGIDRPDE